MRNTAMKRMKKLLLIMLVLLGLAVLCLFVPDGLMLYEAQNAYYIGEPPASYQMQAWPYGCTLALGAMMSVLCMVFLIRHSNQKSHIARFAALSVWLGILFSRVLYCLVNTSFYAEELSNLAFLRLWEGGMSMAGALLGAALAARLAAKKAGDRRFLDAAAISLGFFVFAARIGEKYTTMGFGMDVDFSGLFVIDGNFGGVLNVWLIESLVALFILITLIILNQREKGLRGDGLPIFFLLYGTAQILMESLRADRHMIWGFVKAQQVLAMLMATGALIIFAKRVHRIPAAIIASMATAVLSFGLEKALDRLDISPLILYFAYVLVLASYLAFSFFVIRRIKKQGSYCVDV
jgi:prolipoprotein diacylglyceryltransferase